MKNLLKFSLFSFALIGVVACSEDDGGTDGTTEENIEGQWEMKNYEGQAETEDSTGASQATMSMTGSNFTGNMNFNADKTFESDLGFDVTVITSFAGVPLDTTTFSSDDLSSSGTWSMENNSTLMLHADGEEASHLEIVSLTSNEMVLKSVEEDTDGGVTTQSEAIITLGR